MTVGEPITVNTEIDPAKAQLLQQTLATAALTHSGFIRAEEQLCNINHVVQQMLTVQEKAREVHLESGRQAEGALWRAQLALTEVLEPAEVNTGNVLDYWYEYRRNIHFDTFEHREAERLIRQDECDREAFERLVPGTLIMNLRPSLGETPMIDTVAAKPHLEVRGSQQQLSLLVSVETDGSRAAKKDWATQRLAYHYRFPGIHHDLEGLSDSLLTGEEAIKNYFDGYEPEVLTGDAAERGYGSGLYQAMRDARYAEALQTSGLGMEVSEAVRKLTTAMVANCRTLTGIETGGVLNGIQDGIHGSRLLEAVKRMEPAAYAQIIKDVALGIHEGAYRYPEKYSELMAEVEGGRPKREISFEQKAAVHAELKLRGAALAEIQALQD